MGAIQKLADGDEETVEGGKKAACKFGTKTQATGQKQLGLVRAEGVTLQEIT